MVPRGSFHFGNLGNVGSFGNAGGYLVPKA